MSREAEDGRKNIEVESRSSQLPGRASWVPKRSIGYAGLFQYALGKMPWRWGRPGEPNCGTVREKIVFVLGR